MIHGVNNYNHNTTNKHNKEFKNYNNFVLHHNNNNIIFLKCEVGDCVKFKSIKEESENKMKSGLFIENKFSSYFGKITQVTSDSTLMIIIDPTDDRLDFPKGVEVMIDRRSILQIYPSKLIKHITPRIAMKHLWKDLVFREIKATKCDYRNLKYVQYNYVNKSGFTRIKRFRTLEEALARVNPTHHKNITVHHQEYYGFTYDKALRNNDKYFDREIFFSKKCYSELDFSDKNPTGDFLLNERSFNDIPPKSGSLVCGLVENGEKGLFFRKWFVCSREFLLLWTMVCDPKDSSLNEELGNKVKSIDTLTSNLDTSLYTPDMLIPVPERQAKYVFQNLERTALFYSNRYKSICNVLFKKNSNKKIDPYDYKDFSSPFEKNFYKNIMWVNSAK